MTLLAGIDLLECFRDTDPSVESQQRSLRSLRAHLGVLAALA